MSAELPHNINPFQSRPLKHSPPLGEDDEPYETVGQQYARQFKRPQHFDIARTARQVAEHYKDVPFKSVKESHPELFQGDTAMPKAVTPTTKPQGGMPTTAIGEFFLNVREGISSFFDVRRALHRQQTLTEALTLLADNLHSKNATQYKEISELKAEIRRLKAQLAKLQKDDEL